jgi:hypothetical protein
VCLHVELFQTPNQIKRQTKKNYTMIPNTVFFDYIESLIKEDKIQYAFIQIEAFLEKIERTKGEVAELAPAKTYFTLIESRYARWRTDIARVDSRDSKTEINQIVAGLVDGLVLLKNLPDIHYMGFSSIAEPANAADIAEEVVGGRSFRKLKWYWWVAIVLGAFSAAGVTYLLFFKTADKPLPKPIPPKKGLTLILHELGDRASRMDNQGRLIISDMNNQRIGKDIEQDGIVQFDSLPSWFFKAKPFVVLDLQGLDERAFEYRLLDSLYTTFTVNDTVYIPFIKKEKTLTPDPDKPVIEEKYSLYFYSEKTRTKKSFAYAKNNTIKQLKDFIINKFVDRNTLRYGTETKLDLGDEHIELSNEQLSLKDTKLKNNDVLYLHIIDTRAAARTQATIAEAPVNINIKGQRFTEPVIKINNNAVKSSKTKEGLSVTVPQLAVGEKCTISIQDGDTFYTHEMEAPKLKEMNLDVNTMRKSAIKSTMEARMKVEPLQPK